MVPATIDSAFYNGGEACASSERLLVHEDIHDEFLERFRSQTETLVVGSGTDPEADIGPLSSNKQFEKVSGYISVGKTGNAELVFAGETPDGKGYFIAPHIFDNVDPNTRLFNEEVFGPVISITTFGTEKEAIDLANRVEYGLTGAVWSADAKRSMRVARNVDVGYMMVNTYYRGRIGAPFGGYDRSGNGRKFAFEETMQEFSRVKTIRYNTGSSKSW